LAVAAELRQAVQSGLWWQESLFSERISLRKITNGHIPGALPLFQITQSLQNSRDGNLVLGRDKQAFFSARRLCAEKDAADGATVLKKRQLLPVPNNVYDNDNSIILSALRLCCDV